MTIYSQIQFPTLLLDESKARANIRGMVEKARRGKVFLRPHFKTHQSAEIGEWFRAEGVTAISVSSLQMAQYFTDNGWDDITIAFPVNIREVENLQTLARKIHLGLLVEASETISFLTNNFSAPVDIWIKIDSGLGRTGLHWAYFAEILQLSRQIQDCASFHLAGILTHAGHTYLAPSPAEVCNTYTESVQRMNMVRDHLLSSGISDIKVSVGDTPGCRLAEDLGKVDEIRPGNYVFYDATMLQLGVCKSEEIAVAIACPVVAIHPERSEAIIYGGATHLSKDFFKNNGDRCFGLVALPTENGWTAPLTGAYVRAVSQEHGVIRLQPQDLAKIKIGDLVCILPAHSCLVVSALHHYLTLDGRQISTINEK
jgi:D-serine deaminase-like pyridoxal phosphate-dependent protein